MQVTVAPMGRRGAEEAHLALVPRARARPPAGGGNGAMKERKKERGTRTSAWLKERGNLPESMAAPHPGFANQGGSGGGKCPTNVRSGGLGLRSKRRRRARIREALVTACTCRSRARSTAAEVETPRRYVRESKGDEDCACHSQHNKRVVGRVLAAPGRWARCRGREREVSPAPPWIASTST